MHKKLGVISALSAALMLSSMAIGQEHLRWQPTLESAKQLAAQTNRLVLIHFWAEWCGACRSMERDVLSQPAVAAVIEANYVPVKINRDYFPATCRLYGVTALPSQVIITPDGNLVDRFQGRLEAGKFISRLNQVAAAARGHQPPVPVQIPAGPPRLRATPPSLTPGPASPTAAPSPRVALAERPYAGLRNRPPQVPPAATDPTPPQAPAAAPSISPPADNPPLGFDGYCPVQLIDDLGNNNPQWTLGDRRWGAIHRGRTYLFAGAEHQRRFLADPDRFAPVLSGSDIVLAVDERQDVAGRRAHGVLFGGRIYLFAGEATLNKFSEAPHRYAIQALRAMRAATPGGGEVR